MSTVIKVENISKQYRLGEVGTGALSHDINRWWHKVRGKENPYLQIGEANDRTTKGDSDYVWALKDINFEVKQGEVLGIIGRNGAGKSTLLKILSKTTTPTTGSIKIKGRIASLLEVGTGFHPELSGRDNIFLNGAILGMTKREIKSKFDEIVDFAGVERYIDTPVKRYSSGMYVRLAFGVAAHLEPEILIVDEVLAVGDAEFQKKALGKMKSVSEEGGRTVIFVSHNMVAMNKICNKGILLSDGIIDSVGDIKKITKKYLSKDLSSRYEISSENIQSNSNKVLFISGNIKFNQENINPIISEPIDINVKFQNFEKINLNVTLMVFTENEEHVLSSTSLNENGSNYMLDIGMHEINCRVPSNFFNTGIYFFSILFVEDFANVIINCEKAFSVDFEEDLIRRGGYLGTWSGIVRPQFEWELK